MFHYSMELYWQRKYLKLFSAPLNVYIYFIIKMKYYLSLKNIISLFTVIFSIVKKNYSLEEIFRGLVQ